MKNVIFLFIPSILTVRKKIPSYLKIRYQYSEVLCLMFHSCINKRLFLQLIYLQISVVSYYSTELVSHHVTKISILFVCSNCKQKYIKARCCSLLREVLNVVISYLSLGNYHIHKKTVCLLNVKPIFVSCLVTNNYLQ